MKLYFIAFLLSFSIIIMGSEIDLPVVPATKLATKLSGNFKIVQGLKIITGNGASDDLRLTALQLKQVLKLYNKISAEIVSDDLPGNLDIVLDLLDEKDSLESYSLLFEKDESYKLSITETGISIKSASTKGIFYGAMSLIQLLEKSIDNKIQSVEIIDWPDIKVRGVSEDISRGQIPTIDYFKDIIRFLSRYKLNTYMLYIEDVLKLDCYPSIGNKRGALTKEEVRELISFANAYHIEIVPIFQTLGHFENILNEREFLRYAEFPGAACLNISDKSTYIFLEKMIKEVCELFPSKFFHMGADESWDFGLGESKKMIESSGIADAYLKHYKRIYEIVKQYDKTVLMYSDNLLEHPELLKKLPKDIIIVDWQYHADYDYLSAKKLQEAGFAYYVSPSVNNFKTTFPDNSTAIPNIKNFIKSGVEYGTSGVINSNWGDFGAETFKELCLPGYAWSAQCSWNFKTSNENKFFVDFYHDFYGVRDNRTLYLHELFNSLNNRIYWNDLWRHPLLPIGKFEMNPASKISWLEETIPVMENAIYELQMNVLKKSNYLDIMHYLTELYEWYKIKLQTGSMLKNKVAGGAVDDVMVGNLINENITRLKKLKNGYRNLWVKYNKIENLELIEDKFDRMMKYFDEISQQLKSGELADPGITSKWIYYKPDEKKYVREARFKKEINLKQVPKSAYLQLMGDTHAKLFINGKYVDEIFARFSQSLSVEYKRIKFIDVSEFLKKGDNIITVEVKNFEPVGSAGFNLISEIKYPDNTIIKIQSDNTWKVQHQDDDIDDEDDWKEVTYKDYPHTIIAPNFVTKRASWIER